MNSVLNAANVPAAEGKGSSAFLDYDKALACVHCGLCLSSCPTYLETGNENDSPRGRIHLMRALHDGRLPLADAAVGHIDLCLGCRACEAACPSGVQYGALLEATREHIEQRHSRSFFQTFLRRVAIEQVFPFPERLDLVLRPARLLKRLGLDRFLPPFLRGALALVPEQADAEPLPEQAAASVPRRGRVGFVSGCVMSAMFSRTNAASIRLLNAAGYDVVTPPGQSCCGALYAHGGSLEAARDCARRNLAVFAGLDVDAVIINAAGCGSTLKEYGHLLENDPVWAERATAFGKKIKDLSEWLADAFRASDFSDASARGGNCVAAHQTPSTPGSAGIPAGALLSVVLRGMKKVRAGKDAGAPRQEPLDRCERGAVRDPETPVTFHDACHLAHAQRITQPPRDLVRAIAAGSFVELPEADVCCGSAGSYNLTEPDMAARLQRRKIDNILKTGARVVVTTNPGCLLQIQAGLRAAGAAEVRVLHLADYLDEAIRISENAPCFVAGGYL